MKKLLILLVAASIFSCKEKAKDNVPLSEETVENSKTVVVKEYPKEIAAVLEAHGGLAQWNKMNNLCFELPKETGSEIHTISLKDRHCKIETNAWSIGYDGSEVWLLENEPGVYKGNARFYHNLMFYFYAMPFVLSDDGIHYENVAPKELDGTTYPGIKISYGDGIGDSPKDEYILYYDEITKKMSWLGYTVTYKSNEKSDRWSYINYAEWTKVNGLELPKKLTWYTVVDGVPAEVRSSRDFEKITVTETQLDDKVFAKPAKATVSPRE